MAKHKDELVPYDQVSPGFEAAYTGETSSSPAGENEMTATLRSDEDGNLISQWSTIPWTFPDKEDGWEENQWDDTVKCLHKMQSKLGSLTDDTRLLRSHITGLIPCDSGLPVTVDELLFAIDQFVLSGGRTLIFLDPYSEALSGVSGMPSVQRSDLQALLPNWGLTLREGVFVKDYENSMVVGVGAERNPVRHLGLLGLSPTSMSSEDIVLFGLESVNMSTVGILDVIEGSTTTVTPLIQSSDQSQAHAVEALLDLQDPQTLMKDFAPTGDRYTLAARVTGSAKTAFPEGVEIKVLVEKNVESDAEEATEGEQEPEYRSETLTPVVKESDSIQLMVVSDSDILSDRLWVQVQNFFGQQIVTPWADNASLLMNSLETMSGDPDLVEIRSQGRFNRPFTRVDMLRRDAEESFYAEQEVLQSELSSLEEKLVELEQLRGEGEGAMFSPEQELELVKFQEEKLKVRKRLREVQHQLDKDIESLGTQLKLINILLIPGLICLFVLMAGARRRFS